MTKPQPIKDRIRAALADGPLPYWDLARSVFPKDRYPKAFTYQADGGPPGCYLAPARAIRGMGLRRVGYGPGATIYSSREK